jgi:ubiquinone biosynthesis protein
LVLEKKRRHLERYIEIGRILAKHGWEHILGRLGLAEVFRVRRQAMGVPPGPAQVRESLEELGPTFIKLGQLLSTRPDVIPKNYADELEKLQDSAPPITFATVRQVVEQEFGIPIDRVFATFDPEPLASASLGQTHLATLFDGREVVVKVQRPGIRQQIDTDLEIMAGVAIFLEQHFEQARIYGLSDMVDEFSIIIHQEMDYTREGRNADKLRENFAGVPTAKIADIIWDYTTARVLTQERLCGIKINDIEALDARGYDRAAIANNLSRAFLKMIFVDGFFHSDPHPGNLVVLDDNVVGIMDYGQVDRLDTDLKTKITMLLSEYIQEDSGGFAETILDMGAAPPDLNRVAYTRDIDRLLRQYYDVPLSEVQIGDMLRRTLQISARYRIRLPANVAVLTKAIVEVESTDRLLDPNYNLTRNAGQYIDRSIRGELTVDKMRSQILRNLLSWKNLLLSFPHRSAEILENMAENRFRIIFKHEGLEVATKDIDRSANRLSFALMASSIIIGSALILSAKVGPLYHGYAILGLVGFGISFLLAVWLMISIIRAGSLW